MGLGTFVGEALTDVRVSVRGQVHRASLKAEGWLVSILLQTHLWLLCNPCSNLVSTSPSAKGGHGDR